MGRSEYGNLFLGERSLRILPGQYYDVETGKHYNYFRDYDPSIGRYVQSDPVGIRAGVNTYSYVRQRPLARIDPFGLIAGKGLAGTLKDFGKDLSVDQIGKMLGKECGEDCKQMRNPRRDPDEVASEVCNMLTNDLGLVEMHIAAIMLECRKKCVEVAKEHCDKKKTSCAEGSDGAL